MFSKPEKPNEAARGASNPPGSAKGAPSLISSGLQITGNLKSEGEIQVDGLVDGDIQCARLTVGEGANIHGEIVADHVMVLGRVDGRIRARAVELEKTAHVTGDILHDSLTVTAGAFVDGLCKRNEAGPAGATKDAASPGPASTAPAAPQPGAAPAAGPEVKKAAV